MTDYRTLTYVIPPECQGIPIERAYPTDLVLPPECQGMTIDRAYSTEPDENGRLYRRTTNHGFPAEHPEHVRYAWMDGEDLTPEEVEDWDPYKREPDPGVWYELEHVWCGCDSCSESTWLDPEDKPLDDEWRPDESVWLCPECQSYSVSEDGEAWCVTHDIPDDIDWGAIQTGAPGVSNWQEGTDSEGQRWRREDNGEWTAPWPLPEHTED